MIRFLFASVVAVMPSVGADGEASLSVDRAPPRARGGSVLRAIVRAANVAPDPELRLVWTLRFADRPVTGEVTPLRQPDRVHVEMRLPEVRARTRVRLDVSAWQATRRLAHIERPLELFPTGVAASSAKGLAGRPVGLVESDLAGGSLEKAAPLAWQRLSSAASVRHFAGDMIFVRVGRAFHRRSALRAALVDRVADGATVICLGDEPTPFVPLAVEKTQGRKAVTQARILARSHPVLGGLTAKDFSAWGIDGIVGRSLPVWLTEGNRQGILDAPSETGPQPLLDQIHFGRGRILYCGLAVPGKVPEEPVAELVLANLARWGVSPGPRFGDARSCVAEDGPVGRMLRALGVAGAGPGQPTPVVIGAATTLSGPERKACAGILARGGMLLLFGLTDESLTTLNSLLRTRWLRDPRGQPPCLAFQEAKGDTLLGFDPADAHPLLAGVRPEDVRALRRDGWDADVRALRAVADREHFQALLGNGLVSKLQRDGAGVVVWQLPVEPVDSPARRRVLAALVTNLGVRLAHAAEK